MRSLSFLVVEDDELARLSLTSMLEEYGQVSAVDNARSANELLSKDRFQIAFIDLDLERELAGLELVPKASSSGCYTVVVSGREEDEYIEDAYNKGCEDYLTKPFIKEALLLILRKYEFLLEQGELKSFFSKKYITQDEKTVEELNILNEVVASKRPVLIQGATGTGKTMVAELIHQLVHKGDAPFVALNCSEIPENLMESELFGHEKGAFSGADNSKKGKLELANGGTLFLDEIATMPASLQQKLLKAVEEKIFYPLGSEKPVETEFRLISATCEDLSQMVKDKKFREDLYFRIEGFNIYLPSLFERTGDIPLLIKHFLKKGFRRVVFDKEAKDALESYHWPGNVRELQKAVEMLQAKKSGVVRLTDLPEHIQKGKNPFDAEAKPIQSSSDNESVGILDGRQIDFIEQNGLKQFIEVVEDQMVEYFYQKNNEKVRQTLGQLKISNSSFYRIMDRLKKSDGDQ